MFDAHCHTDCSDGNITIEDRIHMIRSLGYKAATITDHDFISTEQIARARAAAGSLPYIPGIELSLRHGDGVVHLLGYFVDPEHPGLQDHLQRVQAMDRAITIRLLAAFQIRGAAFELADLEADSLHTFYSMQLVKRLAKDLYNYDAGELMPAFLTELDRLGLTYAAMAPWTVKEGIALIHAAGGIAVLAHPGGREDDVMQRLGFLVHDEAILASYLVLGLDGLEVRNPVHSLEEIAFYESYCRRHGLLMTAGSDCHGDDPYLGPAVMGHSVDLIAGLYESMLQYVDRDTYR